MVEQVSVMGKLEDCKGEGTSFGLCARQHLCWVKCSYAETVQDNVSFKVYFKSVSSQCVVL